MYIVSTNESLFYKEDIIDQLDDVLGKKRISRAAIENIRDMLVRMT